MFGLHPSTRLAIVVSVVVQRLVESVAPVEAFRLGSGIILLLQAVAGLGIGLVIRKRRTEARS